MCSVRLPTGSTPLLANQPKVEGLETLTAEQFFEGFPIRWDSHSFEHSLKEVNPGNFRELYLKYDPELSRLPSLVLDKNGETTRLLENLKPLSLEQLQPLLTQMETDSQETRKGTKEEIGSFCKNLGPNFSEISAYISKQLSAAEIENLDANTLTLLTDLWLPSSDRHPKPYDKNGRPWLERLIKDQKSSALYVMTLPEHSRSENNWTTQFDTYPPELLWNLFAAIPYAGPVVLPKDPAYAELTPKQREIQSLHGNQNIQKLCQLVSEKKWGEMIGSATQEQLCWLIEEDRLGGNITVGRLRILLNKLGEDNLSIRTQKAVLTQFGKEFSKGHPIMSKIDSNLWTFWEKLLRAQNDFTKDGKFTREKFEAFDLLRIQFQEYK